MNICSFKHLDLAELLPHGSDMCLIDKVTYCDKDRIQCESESHLRGNNPLQINARVHSCILAEYAAQTAALHAAHINSHLGKKQAAFVGAIKKFSWENTYLPEKNIQFQTQLELNSNNGAIYSFKVTSRKKTIASGSLVLITPSKTKVAS
ncbi:hypothetical protein [Agaribacterium sp. ZY112]|uniref:hypothetical protein n=1 Tax=Agaribacterium sp. ZY112 TaxID=3233574 RepID=UPI0035235B1F